MWKTAAAVVAVTFIQNQDAKAFYLPLKSPPQQHKSNPFSLFLSSNENMAMDETSARISTDPNKPTKSSDEMFKTIEDVRDSFGFRNDGKYWFMKTLMAPYSEGARLFNGIPMQQSNNISSRKNEVSEEEIADRRQRSASELVNIDDMERNRRIESGNLCLALTALVTTYIVTFIDQGDLYGHLIRFIAIYPFFAVGYGLRKSGKAGL